MAFLEQLEQLKDDVHTSYVVMSEVLQEHKVDVAQIDTPHNHLCDFAITCVTCQRRYQTQTTQHPLA